VPFMSLKSGLSRPRRVPARVRLSNPIAGYAPGLASAGRVTIVFNRAPWPLRTPPLRGLRLPCSLILAEHAEHLAIERRDVIRLATGDQVVVHDDFLIDPIGAGVLDVGL
jgi:hypothetical protein